MSLSLSQNYSAIGPNLTASFLGGGGSAPYTYSVLPGGVGGSINSSTGVYTAPNAFGSDTIEVVDSLLATAQANILIGSPIELLCDIIETEMNLTQGQVYLWNQKINIPTDSRLYVAVRVLSCKPFGNSTRMDTSGNSVQSVNMYAMVSVDILSRGPSARDRKEEVILAMHSQYAESQQEANSFYIAQLSSSFTDLSEIDGPAIPYRFNIGIAMQYSVSKTSTPPYYDNFEAAEINTDP